METALGSGGNSTERNPDQAFGPGPARAGVAKDDRHAPLAQELSRETGLVNEGHRLMEGFIFGIKQKGLKDKSEE